MSKRTLLLRSMKREREYNRSFEAGGEKLDMCIDALEKQVAKKIERYSSNIVGEMMFNCPSCNLEYYVTDYEDFNYCPNCGQKILWEE